MQIMDQGWNYESYINEESIMYLLESVGRNCYKSEDMNSEHDFSKTQRFVKSIINKNHEGILEHASFTVRIITDRATQNQIVRHRMAAYCVESQRYCNYSKDKFNKEITFVKPLWVDGVDIEESLWYKGCQDSEAYYFGLITQGAKPEQARSVLNNSVKSEILMTCNLRQWRHFLKLRTSMHAQPEVRALARSMLDSFKEKLPTIFEDITYE